MEAIESAYRVLLSSSAVFLSLLLAACLIRAILGPRFTDRVVSINVICTKTIIMIGILSCLLDNSSLLDIAIVYAMIAFLAVVVLSKCYIMPHHANPVELYFAPMDGEHVGEKKEELK
jgi:multicomponent Na+:H+ antiporter subunit F